MVNRYAVVKDGDTTMSSGDHATERESLREE